MSCMEEYLHPLALDIKSNESESTQFLRFLPLFLMLLLDCGDVAVVIAGRVSSPPATADILEFLRCLVRFCVL